MINEKQITLEGWKGKDHIEILFTQEENIDIWIVIENRKDKESKGIIQNKHKIPNINVKQMRNYIRQRTIEKDKTNYRELALDIIKNKNLSISIEEFNGGLNRSKYYFPYYYYPLKILEFLKEINYSGRGAVSIINNVS